jgi:hypothetical protein
MPVNGVETPSPKKRKAKVPSPSPKEVRPPQQLITRWTVIGWAEKGDRKFPVRNALLSSERIRMRDFLQEKGYVYKAVDLGYGVEF